MNYVLYSFCGEPFYFNGSAIVDLPPGAFVVTGPNPYLGASLQPTVVTLTDDYDPSQSRTLTISGTWTSTTSPTRSVYNLQEMFPGELLLIHSVGLSADATANVTALLPNGANIAVDPDLDPIVIESKGVIDHIRR